MGTRSRIALEYADGMILSIYCHWDGYILGVGQTLHENYKTRDKVQQLMELGDLSALGPTIGEQHDFDWHRQVPSGQMESDPRFQMCTAYRRDRGEEDVDASTDFSRNELVSRFDLSDQEYLYLFTKNDYWTVWEGGRWQPLLVRLLAEEAKEAA